MSATTELIARAALAWMKHRPFSEASRAARRKARKLRKGECSCPNETTDDNECPIHGEPARQAVDEVAEDFNVFPTAEKAMTMNGFKTYTGIAVALLGVALGWLGVGETEAAALATQIVTVGGLIFATYGRIKAKPAA